jgi:hypothetical protein
MKCEFLVSGDFDVNGTPTNKVEFRSVRATPDSTDWGGFNFYEYTQALPSYGFACDSDLQNATIKDALYGVRIQGHCGPSLRSRHKII